MYYKSYQLALNITFTRIIHIRGWCALVVRIHDGSGCKCGIICVVIDPRFVLPSQEIKKQSISSTVAHNSL